MDVISVVGFLKSLFPFFPLGNLIGGEQFLSAWSVLLLMVLSIGFGYRLMAKTKQINQGLHAAVEQPTANYLADHPFLKREWADYQRGFVNTAEGLSKTHQPASTYFNEYNVLSHNLTLRFWYSFPNYLVGLGILGTFVGLTFGISGINTSDTTQMREGINTLLSGMGLAFVTSIWGMLLSIVFNIFEKTRFSAVNKALSELCFALDERYHMTQQEKISLELQQRQESQAWWDQQLQQQLLNQFSHEDSGGNTILSGVVLRELLKESQQQTQALKSFSSDLADGIMLSSQTVETMGQQFAKMLEEPFQTQFTPAIVKIEEAVNKLREAKEESSNKLIEETLNNFKQQMQQATSSFQDTLSNSAQDSFERLATTIDMTGKALSGFPDEMQKMLLNMQEQTDQVQQHLQTMAQQLLLMSQQNQEQIQSQTTETIEQLKHSVMSMQQETSHTVGQLKTAVSEMQASTSQLMNEQNTQSQNLHNQWSQVGDELMQSTRKNSEQIAQETQQVMENIQGVITSLQNNMKGLILQQAQEAKSSQILLEESRQMMQESQQFINEVKNTLLQFSENYQRLNEVSEKLLSTGEYMQTSSGNLASMGQSFKEQVRDFLSGNQESLKKLEHALTAAKETEVMYGERFTLIQNGLSGVFGEVEQGLSRYQNTTRDQLNRSLADFSDNLSQAAKHLSSAVEELAEVVEETQELRSHS